MTIYKISQKDYRYRTISVTTPHHIKKRLFEAINDPPSVRPFEPARNNIPGELTDLGCLEKVVRTTFISLLIYALYGHWKPYMMSNGGVLSFTAISGFFEHDNEPEGPEFRATTTHNLGLISRGYSTDRTFDPRNEKSQWERLINYLDHLNREGASKYKLFFLARHGEGYHNVKEAQVGRADWERYWARLDGDEASTWFDAHLTEKGKQQAAAINTFLRTSAAQNGIPLPTRHYTSPLSRCLETTRLAFYQLDTDSSREKPKTVIKECLREGLGIHTCDRRRTRSWIHETYLDYEIEDEFTENDELWKPDIRESMDDHIVRISKALEDIFENDSDSIVSLTAHSGAIRALYAAIGHRETWVGPGAMVPVLVKADLVK